MFHVKHLEEELQALSEALPWSPDWDRLAAYESWLRDEALVAGGIGPSEAERLVHRHIGDSLTYALAFDERPGALIDYGSGVGLPGLPLAMLWPETHVMVQDRARRRTELLQRAVRVLRLENVIVEQSDASSDRRIHEAIVTRAVFQIPKWLAVVGARLSDSGRAVTSLGTVEAPTAPAGFAIRTIELGVLDHEVRLLIMSRTEADTSPDAEGPKD